MTGLGNPAARLLLMVWLGVGPVLAGTALAQGKADKVGQVTQVAGTVTSQAAQAHSPRAVSPFQKIRPGDSFTLAPGSVVRLVYFGTEREETWTGPGIFTVGDRAGQGRDGLAPVVAQPDPAPQAGAVQGEPKGDLAKGGFLQVRGRKHVDPPLP